MEQHCWSDAAQRNNKGRKFEKLSERDVSFEFSLIYHQRWASLIWKRASVWWPTTSWLTVTWSPIGERQDVICIFFLELPRLQSASDLEKSVFYQLGDLTKFILFLAFQKWKSAFKKFCLAPTMSSRCAILHSSVNLSRPSLSRAFNLYYSGSDLQAVFQLSAFSPLSLNSLLALFFRTFFLTFLPNLSQSCGILSKFVQTASAVWLCTLSTQIAECQHDLWNLRNIRRGV